MKPLTEQEIRAIIQQEIRSSATSSRFQVKSIDQHKHNNIDSPATYSPVLTYIGFVPSDGNVNGGLEYILPKGWTLLYNGTGSYTITHNLGTMLYSVVVSATQSTNNVVAAVISPFANEFDSNWFLSSDAITPTDTSFFFILTQINNKKSSLPQYISNVS